MLQPQIPNIFHIKVLLFCIFWSYRIPNPSHFIAVLVPCKYEEDSIKNDGARVLTTLYIEFSDAQGQLTQ